MMLRRIHIENFRAYKQFDCEFAEGVNLVIGDNGTGKTSLLAAIAQLFSAQTYKLCGNLGIEAVDPHIEIERVGDVTQSIKECFPIVISGEVTFEDEINYDFGVIHVDYGNRRNNGHFDMLKNLTDQEGATWPLISFQRFDRDWKLGKSIGNNTVSIETGLNERRDGYRDCLKGNGQEDSIQKWCLKMSMLEFEKNKSIREFEHFKHIIKTFLQSIEETEEDFDVSYSVEFSGLVMKKGNCLQPLYELSTGYKALLSMIMELAYRAVLLNPDADKNDDKQIGIVIIDEIDAHLHPKWQWRIIDALTKCFPMVQFIIATHSPIVISSAKNARLINLEEIGRVSYSEGAYGFNVSDVLDLKQGSISMPKVSAVYMAELETALDDGNLVAADQVVLNAEKEFGTDSPVYMELRDYLDVNRWVEAD